MRNEYYKFIRLFKAQFLILSLVFFSLLGFISLFTYIYFAKDLNKERIMNRKDVGITIFDENERPFFTFYDAKIEKPVTLSQIPTHTQQAVIATEDKNFYTNPGFSVQSMIRALFVNIKAGEIKQGGSTITQELVKNSILNSKKSFLRKYQEVVLASEINRKFTKNEILEIYLNSIYFGEGAFGIDNAAHTYFNKHSHELTLAESALLIGLLPAPSSLSPVSNDPDKAKQRQKIVLKQMVKEKYITNNQAKQAEKKPLFYSKEKNDLNSLAPHFALFVRSRLIKEFGEDFVVRSGFKVKTTLNSKWQEYAENALKNHVSSLSGLNVSNGAIVAIDPDSSQIKVMAGSVNWYNNDFGKLNMAITTREPGSAFKPIIYAYALEKEIITPASILRDETRIFERGYIPSNFDNKTRGPVTVRRALANSLNIPSVEVMEKVGVVNGVEIAKKLGITTLRDPSNYGLSLVLGATEVNLLELTNIYAIFANGGTGQRPIFILEIKDKYDNIVYSHSPKPKSVLPRSVAFLITSILSDNQTRQETFGNLLSISRSAAVKTGTSESFRNALTIGYTPNLAVGVWIGNNNNAPMNSVAGSLGAAPLWKNLMEAFFADLPNKNFSTPLSVTAKLVCPYKDAGSELVSSSAYMEYFIRGTEPQEECVTPTPLPIPEQINPVPSEEITPTPTPSPEPLPTQTPIENEENQEMIMIQ